MAPMYRVLCDEKNNGGWVDALSLPQLCLFLFRVLVLRRDPGILRLTIVFPHAKG